MCAFFLRTFLLYEGVTRAEGASVIIIQIFSFARTRRINIYNAFPSANPLARAADREKSSRFKQTFLPFLFHVLKMIYLQISYWFKIYIYKYFF